MKEKLLQAGRAITTIQFFAFKKRRQDSILKHTGVHYIVNSDAGVKEYIHEVTNGADGFVLFGPNKSRIVTRDKDASECFESTLAICTIVVSHCDDIEDLFVYEEGWEYNVLWKNCRDHVRHFVSRLRSRGASISETVEDWISEIKRNDVAIGTGLVVAGVGITAAVIAAINYFTSPDPVPQAPEALEVDNRGAVGDSDSPDDGTSSRKSFKRKSSTHS